jgi:hypothetical protein
MSGVARALGEWGTAHLIEPVVWPIVLGLLAAHALAEFLTQSPAASELRAARNVGWARHGASVFAWILAVAWPVMPSKQGLAVALLVTAGHLLVDGARATWFDPERGRRVAGWVFDGLAHAVVIWAGAALYVSFEGAPTRPLLLSAGEWNGLYLGATLIAFASNGVAAGVARMLARFDVSPPREPLLLEPPPDSPPEMGRLIGILERWLVMLFVAAGQWGAVGLVMAAKSIARFRQLEERRFSEYYLIGTLCSLLAAVLLGLGLERALEIGLRLGFRVGG